MNRKRITYFIATTLLFLAACSHKDNVVKNTKSGFFTLAEIKTSTPGGRRQNSADEPTFDLGAIKASKEFFFLLGNGGEGPIFNIQLVTDNDAFVVSPQKISQLNGTISTDNSLIPLISLDIIHGIQLNGVGFTDLLPMGDNSTVFTITGKTLVNGDSVDVISNFTIKVNAKRMDIQLFDTDQEIDLLSPDIFASGAEDSGGLGSLPGYLAPSQMIKIKNIGNVDIVVTTRYFLNVQHTIVNPLPQNQTVEIPLSDPNYPSFLSVIALDGGGTIADNRRIKMGNDGKGYFAIQN